MGFLRRGDIVLANLEPIKGHEQGRLRPCIIIQNDLGNKFSPTTIISPLTSNVLEKEYPTDVFVDKESAKLKKDSVVLLNQIRTIDKSRIIKKISSLDREIMRKVDLALKISLDLE